MKYKYTHEYKIQPLNQFTTGVFFRCSLRLPARLLLLELVPVPATRGGVRAGRHRPHAVFPHRVRLWQAGRRIPDRVRVE